MGAAGQGWGQGWTLSFWASPQCSRLVQPHKIPRFPVTHWAATTRPEHGTVGHGHMLGHRDRLRGASPLAQPHHGWHIHRHVCPEETRCQPRCGQHLGLSCGLQRVLEQNRDFSLSCSFLLLLSPFKPCFLASSLSLSPAARHPWSRSLPYPLCPTAKAWCHMSWPALGCCKVGTHPMLCCAEMPL